MSPIMQNTVDKVNQNPGAPSGDVLDTIHSIMHLVRSRQFRSLRDGSHELAHMEAKALGFFARRPGATQSELVAHSGRDKAQVARLIRVLRERGLLQAAADEADKRSTRLTLSAQGAAMHAELHRDDGKLVEVALAGIAEAEREVLRGLLAKVRANLEAEAD